METTSEHIGSDVSTPGARADYADDLCCPPMPLPAEAFPIIVPLASIQEKRPSRGCGQTTRNIAPLLLPSGVAFTFAISRIELRWRANASDIS